MQVLIKNFDSEYSVANKVGTKYYKNNREVPSGDILSEVCIPESPMDGITVYQLLCHGVSYSVTEYQPHMKLDRDTYVVFKNNEYIICSNLKSSREDLVEKVLVETVDDIKEMNKKLKGLKAIEKSLKGILLGGHDDEEKGELSRRRN